MIYIMHFDSMHRCCGFKKQVKCTIEVISVILFYYENILNSKIA